MRIGYAIGGLGRGGAELQLLRLSAGLVERGHHVSVIAYDGPSVLDDDFRVAGVDVIAERSASRLKKVAAVKRWIRASQFDVVQGVMKRASSLVLLARWPARLPAIIATDFSTAAYGRRTATLWASLVAFGLADRVVTEIDLNRRHLERMAPWLRGKTVVVRNGLDTDRFAPVGAATRDRDAPFSFCAVGTLSSVKNPLRVVDAVGDLVGRGHTDFRVDWYGRDGTQSGDDTARLARELARRRGVERQIVFHGDVAQIEEAYRQADALIHASVQEGFPNVVAEAMASGLPIVVSGVSDLPEIVAEARNGFVFVETDSRSIASAMERLMAIPREDREAMGARSRELAVRWFRLERYLDDFEALYRTLSARRV